MKSAPSVLVAAPSDPSIDRIETYCREIDAFQEAHSEEARLIASVDGDYWEGKTPKPWTPLRNADEVQKLFDSTHTGTSYDQANILSKNGHVVLANAVLADQTGDWLIYANYYFAEDGKLVKIESQLNTFEGNMTVIRNAYFSPEGKQVRESTEFVTLEGHHKLDKPDGDFVDFPTPRFLTVHASPFRSQERP